MKKLKRIFISNVVAEGFKGYKDKTTFRFDLGKNIILGDNGQGKSSLGDLIAWVFTGRNLDGNKKDLNIINKESTKATGTITLHDQDGEVHEIVRRQTPSSISIKWDLTKVTQAQIDELLSAEVFLAILNPQYYIGLDADTSRKMLISFIPPIKKEDVLAVLGEWERDTLKDEPFQPDSTNEYLKKCREECKTLEGDELYLQGYIDKMDEEIIVPEAKTFDDSQIEILEKQLAEINQRQPEIIDMGEQLLKKSQLQTKIAEVKTKPFAQEETLRDLEQQKALLLQKKETEQKQVFIPNAEIPIIQSKYENLRNDYPDLKKNDIVPLQAELAELDKKAVKAGENCPTCQHPVATENLQAVNQGLLEQRGRLVARLEEKQKALTEVARKGSETATMLKDLKTKDEATKKAFEEAHQKALDDLTKAIDDCLEKIAQLTKEKTQFNTNILAQVQECETQINGLNLDLVEKRNKEIEQTFKQTITIARQEVQEQLGLLRKQKEEVLVHEANRVELQKRLEKKNKDLIFNRGELEKLGEKKTQLKNKIACIKIFNTEQMKMVNDSLKSHLNHVSLRLQKVIESTSEIKDCFEIFYMNKPLKICSNSEKTRAGIELSKMIQELTGCDYPVFIDNGESITHYDEPSHQWIETRVVEGVTLTQVKGEMKETVPTVAVKHRMDITVEEIA